MEHITAVIVEGKHGAVGIPSITHIPFLHLAAGSIHTELVILAASLGNEALDDRREEEPVGIGRIDGAQLLELPDITQLGDIIKRHPELVVGTQEALCDIGGIHQVLSG